MLFRSGEPATHVALQPGESFTVRLRWSPAEDAAPKACVVEVGGGASFGPLLLWIVEGERASG